MKPDFSPDDDRAEKPSGGAGDPGLTAAAPDGDFSNVRGFVSISLGAAVTSYPFVGHRTIADLDAAEEEMPAMLRCICDHDVHDATRPRRIGRHGCKVQADESGTEHFYQRGARNPDATRRVGLDRPDPRRNHITAPRGTVGEALPPGPLCTAFADPGSPNRAILSGAGVSASLTEPQLRAIMGAAADALNLIKRAGAPSTGAGR